MNKLFLFFALLVSVFLALSACVPESTLTPKAPLLVAASTPIPTLAPSLSVVIRSAQGDGGLEMIPGGQKIALWAEPNLKGVSFQWKLIGIGSLTSNTDSTIQYLASQSITQDEEVVITVTATEKESGQTANDQLIIRFLPPTLTPVPPTFTPSVIPTQIATQQATSKPASVRTPLPSTPSGFAVYAGPVLSEGLDMGIDTSEHVFNWVTDMGGYFCMAYPAGQSWGVVYITVGKPAPMGQRQARDLSAYQMLAVDLLGGQGGEIVSIGIKDADDPDNGAETKLPATLTSNWQIYTFPLSKFKTADLTKVYIPIEFVFDSGTGSETVCFRNIQYLK